MSKITEWYNPKDEDGYPSNMLFDVTRPESLGNDPIAVFEHSSDAEYAMICVNAHPFLVDAVKKTLEAFDRADKAATGAYAPNWWIEWSAACRKLQIALDDIQQPKE